MKRVAVAPAGVSLDVRTGLGRRVVRELGANEVAVGRDEDFKVSIVDRAIEGEVCCAGLGHALVLAEQDVVREDEGGEVFVGDDAVVVEIAGAGRAGREGEADGEGAGGACRGQGVGVPIARRGRWWAGCMRRSV